MKLIEHMRQKTGNFVKISEILPKKSVQMVIWEEMTNKNEILRKFRTFFNYVIFCEFLYFARGEIY